jgi:hypothetical protein
LRTLKKRMSKRMSKRKRAKKELKKRDQNKYRKKTSNPKRLGKWRASRKNKGKIWKLNSKGRGHNQTNQKLLERLLNQVQAQVKFQWMWVHNVVTLSMRIYSSFLWCLCLSNNMLFNFVRLTWSKLWGTPRGHPAVKRAPRSGGVPHFHDPAFARCTFRLGGVPWIFDQVLVEDFEFSIRSLWK